MAFTRTISGQISKHLFHKQVIIYVEGIDDIVFYRQFLKNYNCRFEVAGGIDRCWELSEKMMKNDYPYIVVIDGDYTCLTRKRSPHRRLIFLSRYSHENYFFERKVIGFIAADLSRTNEGGNEFDKLFSKLLNSIDRNLLELVILDFAHRNANTGSKVCPKKPYRLLKDQEKLVFDINEIKNICSNRKREINSELYNIAKEYVKDYLNDRVLAHLIRGHFVFGLIRLLIFSVVKSRTGSRPSISNNGLRALLAKQAWLQPLGNDYKSLKVKITRAIRDVCKKTNFN